MRAESEFDGITIVPFGNEYLLISQTQAVHEDIEEWLAQLRSTLASTTASPHTSVVSPEVARIEALLDQPARLAYHEATLETIVEDIEKRYNLEIGIDTAVLDRVDNGWLTIAAKHVVTCDLNEPTLESALQKMLVPLGLDFEIHGEKLWISVATNVSQDEWYAVYDVRALVDPDFGFFTEAELLRLVQVSLDGHSPQNRAISYVYIDDRWTERYFFGGLMIFTAQRRQHGRISKAVQLFNENLATLRALAEQTKALNANADRTLLEMVRSGRRPWECVYAAWLLANQQTSLTDDVRVELRVVNDSLDPLADETLHRVLNWMLDGETSP